MSASPEQLHSALMYCVDFANHMLEDSGEFHPFAAKIDPSGEVIAVGGWTGEEHPNSLDLYKFLAEALHSEAVDGTIIGAAIAVNVNIPAEYSSPLPDGIRVHLDAQGYSRYAYFPYAIETVGLLKRKHKVTLLEPFAVEINPAIFAA